MNLKEWRDFVKEAHGDQSYSGQSYITHCDAAANVAKRFGYNSSIIQAACLGHDLIEDTKVTKGLISQLVGSEVADIIDRVSDKGGGSRKDRHNATYPSIAQSSSAVLVKLCDRIANCETGGKSNMYKSEHLEFKRMLYKKGQFEHMWNHLDNLLK